MRKTNQYQAYLVRFQRGENQPYWRVTIQNTQTGEQLHFASEQELFHYLANALGCQPLDLNSSGRPR